MVIFQGQVTVRVRVGIWEVREGSQLSHLPQPTLSKSQVPALLGIQGLCPHRVAGLDLQGIGHLGLLDQGELGQGSVWTLP